MALDSMIVKGYFQPKPFYDSSKAQQWPWDSLERSKTRPRPWQKPRLSLLGRQGPTFISLVPLQFSSKNVVGNSIKSLTGVQIDYICSSSLSVDTVAPLWKATGGARYGFALGEAMMAVSNLSHAWEFAAQWLRTECHFSGQVSPSSI